MKAAIQLAGPANRRLHGQITLSGSKSISNRVLIIRALCGEDFPVTGLSSARDTQVLRELLDRPFSGTYDVGPAGTTFRFLTAYLCLQPGWQVLTGSDRMKQRPIGILVDALRRLGADIRYLEQEGFPPLRIGEMNPPRAPQRLSVPASTSSQFVSALMLIGPVLPGGLQLNLQGEVVSRPYIDMTRRLMQHFGAGVDWQENTLRIAPSPYQSRPFRVEADWSAAGYYYAMAALAETADLRLSGLAENSLQGDAVLTELMAPFGLRTDFFETGIHLRKTGPAATGPFRYSFLECPDLAQTLAVLCAATGRPGRLEGLRTLRIKETDRVTALIRELHKLGLQGRAGQTASGDEWLELSGQARIPDPPPLFETYADHRMAMAMAPLALLDPVCIGRPEVVGKSYPEFWDHLRQLGFRLTTGCGHS